MRIVEQWSDGRAIEIRGRRKHVLRLLSAWIVRQDPVTEPEPEVEREPDKGGAIAQAEHAGSRRFESEASYFGGTDAPIVQAKWHPTPIIGFKANPASKEAA